MADGIVLVGSDLGSVEPRYKPLEKLVETNQIISKAQGKETLAVGVVERVKTSSFLGFNRKYVLITSEEEIELEFLYDTENGRAVLRLPGNYHFGSPSARPQESESVKPNTPIHYPWAER